MKAFQAIDRRCRVFGAHLLLNFFSFAAASGTFTNGCDMEAKLNFWTPTPASPSIGKAPPSARKLDAKSPATDFSQVLSGQMFKTQQQALASAHSASTSAGLQVVPLGKTMNVITSNAAVPDATSLADFARSQGFDEAAVQALFGPKSST